MRRKLQESIMSTPDLPTGFTELEYLESTGTQWIDTEVLMGNDTVIACKAMATSVSTNANNYLYGLSNTEANCIVTVRHQTPTTFTAQIGTYFSADYNKFETYFQNMSLGTMLEVSTNGAASVTLNNITKQAQYPAEWTAPNMAIPIFKSRNSIAFDGAGTILGKSYYKLYNFTITNGYEKQRDLIPMLDATGKPCMFDLVSRQCFYNKNTSGEDFKYKIKASSN